ncbi:hypothetical protein X975_12306, partial [Stegodyphus mimosarum]
MNMATCWPHYRQLQFISDYKSLSMLWDVNNPDYRNRDERTHAYRMLADKYKITLLDVEKKIKCLRTIFRREHIKVLHKKAVGEKYKPLWFGYEAMLFVSEIDNKLDKGYHSENDPESETQLIKRIKQEPTASTQYEKVVINSVPNETNFEENDELISDDATEHGFTLDDTLKEIEVASLWDFSSSSKKQKKYSFTSSSLSKASVASKKSEETDVRKKDECDIFGEYIACKLRRISSPHAKSIVEHLINNIIFQAEMGRYDDSL